MSGQRGAAPLPVFGASESAEAFLRRLMPQLNQRLESIAAPATVYDTLGRPVLSPAGIHAYAADGRLAIAPNRFAIDNGDLVDGAVDLAKTNIPTMVQANQLLAGDAVILTLLAGELEAVEATIDNLRVNGAQIANLAVDKLVGGIIGVNAIYVGSEAFEIDGVSGRMVVRDTSAVPRVELGALSSGGDGIEVFDGDGNTVLKSGASGTFLSGAHVDELDGGRIAAGTVTADKANITELSALSANLGTMTAGTLAATVSYFGSVAAGQIVTPSLAAITAVLGTVTSGTINTATLRTAIAGKRVEISAATNDLRAYSATGVTLAKLGGEGSDGYGVAATGTTTYPVGYFNNNGSGSGAFGASASGTGVGGYSLAKEGVFGQAAGSSAAHHGVYGLGGANALAAGVLGVSGTGGIGVRGIGDAYDFYADGGSYGPFTGGHDALWPIGEPDPAPGDIVVDTGIVAGRDGVSNAITVVALSSAPGQVGALGVFTGYGRTFTLSTAPRALARPVPGTDAEGNEIIVREWTSPAAAAYAAAHSAITVNAVGEGLVNVTGEGGDIAVGDLIVTSTTPGKGMRQADDVVRSSTVARAREAATFADPADERTIACIYLCG